MSVELTFDTILDLQFLWLARFPIALREEIAKHKDEIYKSLAPSLARPDEITGTREFEVEGRKFLVEFVSRPKHIDPAQVRPLRVFAIHEIK